jgi:hypothetical protein
MRYRRTTVLLMEPTTGDNWKAFVERPQPLPVSLARHVENVVMSRALVVGYFENLARNASSLLAFLTTYARMERSVIRPSK